MRFVDGGNGVVGRPGSEMFLEAAVVDGKRAVVYGRTVKGRGRSYLESDSSRLTSFMWVLRILSKPRTKQCWNLGTVSLIF